jgi:hypothetical protein
MASCTRPHAPHSATTSGCRSHGPHVARKELDAGSAPISSLGPLKALPHSLQPFLVFGAVIIAAFIAESGEHRTLAEIR